MEEGHPVQIVVPKLNGIYELQEEELKSILLQYEVKDKNVAIAGAFRKEKSFILKFFVRYLQSQISFLI
jgi:hypothetical protein